MRLDSSGNLGLGVTPPATSARALYISGYNGGYAAISAGASGGDYGRIGYGFAVTGASNSYTYVTTDFASQVGFSLGGVQFYTAPSGTAGNAITFTQAMTLDASGNLGIGTSSPTSFGSYKFLTIQGANTTNGGALELRNSDNTLNGQIYVGNSTMVIQATSNVPMLFNTNGTERMRLDSSGNLLVGTTSATANIKLRVDTGGLYVTQPNAVVGGSNTIQDSSASPNTLRLYNDTDSNNATQRFLICDAAASVLRAEIRSNGGIANYQANDVNLSDRREKTNFAPAKSYLDAICAIPVQTLNYIDQSENDLGLTLGVVAQDVQAVAPELVSESNWGTADDPKMRLSIYQTDLQYALMKCIQEQQSLIQSLTDRIAQLEAK